LCRRDGRWSGTRWRRQIERSHKVAHFLARRDVAQGQGLADSTLEIEQRQTVQEHLAEDHALAQARGEAKPDAARERVEHRTHVALVARGDRRQTIAHHDPIHRTAALHGAHLALLPHRLGIDGRPHDLERVGVDAGKQIEVDETII